jgi:hypothetical protein
MATDYRECLAPTPSVDNAETVPPSGHEIGEGKAYSFIQG